MSKDSTKQPELKPLLKRRYYRPPEAAIALNTDEETIRQYVLMHFEEDIDRIPLFYETPLNFRVLWIPKSDESVLRTFARREGLLEPNGQVKVFLVETTDWQKPGFDCKALESNKEKVFIGPSISSEFELGPGIWLEIETDAAQDLAARPDQPKKIGFLRAPDYQIGPIPAEAKVLPVDRGPLYFADCWISAMSVERIRASLTISLGNRERENLLQLIGTLCELAGIDLRPDTKCNAEANKLKPALEKRKVKLTTQTIAKKLVEARELISPKGPEALSFQVEKTI